MSIITRDKEIEELKDDVDYLKTLVDGDIQALDQRVDILEDRPYPQDFKDCPDVNITPQVGDNGKVVKFDETNQVFILGDDVSGISEPLNDGKKYV